MSKASDAVDRIKEKIEELTNPKKMSKEEYKEFLQEMITELQIQLDEAEK